MLYFILLFYCYIIILYSSYNILSLWWVVGGMAGAPVFLYRRYLRSCKRFTIHFGALVVVVRPGGVFLCTYHYYLYTTHGIKSFSSSLLCILYIYVCVCAYRGPIFLCSCGVPSRKPPNNNRNESRIYIYIYVGTTPRVCLVII